jgi:hypothetical protein
MTNTKDPIQVFFFFFPGNPLQGDQILLWKRSPKM